jgi:peptide/nickel transport system permease protein
MLKVIARRLLFAIPLLWVVATISFFLVSFIPGDPAQTILGESATAADIAKLRHQLGLDQPLLVQYVVWLGQIVRGDFGTSIILNVSTWDAIAPCIPITTTIAVLATLFAFLIGITLGTLAVVRGGLIDRLVRVWAGISNAIPNFWLAVLLVLIFALKLGWFPAVNWVPFSTSPVEWAKSWILPVTAVSLMGSATVARQARAALLTTLSRDYVRTLLAAGVSRRSVLFKHALRNAAAPVLTVLGFQFIGLLGGSIIVEQVFALQGLGSLVQNAIYTKDLPIVQGIVIFAAVMVVIVNLAIDIFYAWLNPKVRTA